jgi:hypothetical protein
LNSTSEARADANAVLHTTATWRRAGPCFCLSSESLEILCRAKLPREASPVDSSFARIEFIHLSRGFARASATIDTINADIRLRMVDGVIVAFAACYDR